MMNLSEVVSRGRETRVTAVSLAIIFILVALILLSVAGVEWWKMLDEELQQKETDRDQKARHGQLVMWSGILIVLAIAFGSGALLDITLNRDTELIASVVERAHPKLSSNVVSEYMEPKYMVDTSEKKTSSKRTMGRKSSGGQSLDEASEGPVTRSQRDSGRSLDDVLKGTSDKA